jgi:acyl transferase domain-containing protein/acyl carrier protein/ubiquinone/menaquinone biosynthesis C-methylase UbiE
MEEYRDCSKANDKVLQGQSHLFVLSAKNRERLKEYIEDFIEFLERDPMMLHINIIDLTYTLQIGREEMLARLAVIVSSLQDLHEKLVRFSKGDSSVKGLYQGILNRQRQESQEEKEFSDDLQELAQLWLAGKKIDWKRLPANHAAKRISLPSYPFAKSAYWALDMKDTAVSHPMIKTMFTEQNPKRSVFPVSFHHSETPVLRDHKIENRFVLPGVASLENALAAVSRLRSGSLFLLSHVIWFEPLISQGEIIQTQLSLQEIEDGYAFKVTGKNDILHTKGHLLAWKAGNESGRTSLNPEKIKRRCDQYTSEETLYSGFSSLGMDYGPYFRCIKEIWGNREEAIARLRLPRDFEKELDVFTLHPGLMDGAFQTIVGIVSAVFQKKPVLPFSLERMILHQSLKSEVYSYARKTGKNHFDILILDQDGNVLIEMVDFTVKETKKNSKDFFYAPVWKAESELDPKLFKQINQPAKQSCLIVYNQDGLNLAKAIKQNHLTDKVFQIKLGERTSQLSPFEWELKWDNADAIQEITSTIDHINVVYFLNGIQLKKADPCNLESLHRFQEQGVIFLFRLIKAFVQIDRFLHSLRMNIVMNNTFQVNAEPIANPQAAGLFGLTLGLAREYPGVRPYFFDFDRQMLKAPITESLTGQIVTEPKDKSGRLLVWRNGKRFIRKIESLSLSKIEKTGFKTHGVYLILGGAGGIGLALANYLAATFKAKLVLVGRSKLNDKQKRVLSAINSTQAEAIYLQGDATDMQRMAAVIEDAKSHFGPLNGVIHSAMVLNDSNLAQMDEAGFRAAFDPQVNGSIVLFRVLEKEKLDFMLFFSATQSFAANHGQSNYAAGCCFKDSFANFLNQITPYPVKIINWGYWGEVGTTANEAYRQSMAKIGIDSISVNEGMEAIHRILSSDHRQVIAIKAKREILETMGLEPREYAKVADSTTTPAKPSFHTDKSLLRVLQDIIAEFVSNALGIDQNYFDEDDPFSEIGVDSILGVELVNKINDEFDITLKTTTVFDYPTVKNLAHHIYERFTEQINTRFQVEKKIMQTSKSDSTSIHEGLVPVEKREKPMKHLNTDIAVIGISGRFPGADNLEKFWRNLAKGKSAITEIPANRWNMNDYFDPEGKEPGKTYCCWGGFLNHIDKFDAQVFNISGKEAELADPQQRLFLEESWKALEDAGYSKDSVSNSRCGVFVGVAPGDYADYLKESGVFGEPQSFWGNSGSILPARVSYFFNLKGPAIAIDTACSSSLVSIHLACQSIISGECDTAIAGGVFINTTPALFLLSGNAGMLSSDGKCKTFDNSADGFVPGEGVGVLFLKPLTEALANGDHIYCVIKGSGINQDGKTNGITAPSTVSQSELESSVYRRFDIDPETISFVETHGTGTKLGDPVEVEALTQSFRQFTDKKQYCALGSVKTNIGHAAAAAGVASILKVILALRQHKIPPSLNFQNPNEHIDFKNSPFYVNTTLEEWKSTQNRPRRAAVSSFGFSGTNAHLVLESFEKVTNEKPPSTSNIRIVPLSAGSEEKLRVYAQKLYQYLVHVSEEENTVLNLDDIAFTLQVGRKAMPERLFLIVSSISDLCQKLEAFSKGKTNIQNCIQGCAKSKENSELLLEGREGTAFLKIILEERKFEKLGKLWITGVDIDWRLLYSDIKPNRVSLPGYPLAGKRYWVPENTQNRYWMPLPEMNSNKAKNRGKSISNKQDLSTVTQQVPETSAIPTIPSKIAASVKQAKTIFHNPTSRTFRTIDIKPAIEKIEEYSQYLLLNAFQEMGVFQQKTEKYVIRNLKKQLKILPKYFRLFTQMLNIMRKAGFIELRGDEVTMTTRLDSEETQSRLQNLNDTKQRLLGLFPEMSGYVEILDICVSAYSKVLRGALLYTEVMFPEGSQILVENVYKKSVISAIYNKMTAIFVELYVKERLKEDKRARIEILEIGAGTGATSMLILQILRKYEANIVYHLSDISPKFVTKAKRSFAKAYPFIEFKTLDIERDPKDQGIDWASCDLVLATNVIHATKTISNTLGQITKILKINGVLVINEGIHVPDFVTLSFGMTDDWWKFDDAKIRIPGSPIINLDQWKRVLKANHFSSIQVLGIPDIKEENLGQAIFIVENQGGVAKEKPKKEKNVKEKLEVLQDPTKRSVTTPKSDGKSSEIVEKLLCDTILDVLKTEPNDLDFSLAFTDMGVDSLLAVEIVSAINKVFSIELRATELFNYPTLQTLTEHLIEEYPDSIFGLNSENGDQNPLEATIENLLSRIEDGSLSSEEADLEMEAASVKKDIKCV